MLAAAWCSDPEQSKMNPDDTTAAGLKWHSRLPEEPKLITHTHTQKKVCWIEITHRSFFFSGGVLDNTFCLRGCVVIPLACPGSFCPSLVLTSTAKPSGTITTDLASHFQRRDGRPLLSVRALPSSAWITSLPPPPLPVLAYHSKSTFASI